MAEHGNRIPEGLTSNEDITELERVLQWIRRIDDAYESGSGDLCIADLILAMQVDCDPDIITFVQAQRRHDVRLHPKGPAQ